MQPTQVNHLTHTTDVAASTTSRVNVARSRSALGTPFVPSGGKCLKSVVMLRAIRLADHHPEPASRAHAAANDTSKFSRNDTRRWWTGYDLPDPQRRARGVALLVVAEALARSRCQLGRAAASGLWAARACGGSSA